MSDNTDINMYRNEESLYDMDSDNHIDIDTNMDSEDNAIESSTYSDEDDKYDDNDNNEDEEYNYNSDESNLEPEPNNEWSSSPFSMTPPDDLKMIIEKRIAFVEMMEKQEGEID